MDEIRTMTLEEIEERRKAIAEEIPTADAERLTAINAELDLIEERKKEIKTQAEERAKTVEEVLNAPAANPIIEKREEKKMTDREIRSTQEYIDAYAELVKKGYDLDKVGAEKRALLSENANGGTIAVPTFVEDRINAAWENNEIMRRVRRTYLPGNVKVGVELSSTGAVSHIEGGNPIDPENLVIEFVNLIPEYIKKLIEVSHTALEMGPRDFLNYLYDEIEYQLIKKCANLVCEAANSSSYAITQQLGTAGLTTAEIITAEGSLVGDVSPVLITTRANAATLKAAALNASYAYDPFDGLEVLYTDTLPENTAALLVDLDAVQCNFPNGAEPKFVFDEYTKAAENIVRIVGRIPMACALVRTGAAVKLTTGGEI